MSEKRSDTNPPGRGKAAAIIAAGGIGTRMGVSRPKQFMELAGVPILIHTLRAFELTASVSEIVLVAPVDHLADVEALLTRYGTGKVRHVVPGGVLRQDSVRCGIESLSPEIELIAVHDGARPLVTPEIIDRCLVAALQFGAAVAAVPVRDTLKRSRGRIIAATVNREQLWQAQTPQAAKADLLREAFRKADEDGFVGTDESSLLEHLGIPVTLVEGSEQNIKITRPEDISIAEAILGRSGMERGTMSFRIGHGYDAHRFAEGRPLMLGGIEVPFERGLAGHSDADVLVHALCDACLGAVAEGDLGRHFPDSDPRYAGISSLALLASVIEHIEKQGFAVGNADVTVIAQRPKLASYFLAMREKIASVCGISPESVSLKATTTEGMGFAGREEGIAAHAVVLLEKIS